MGFLEAFDTLHAMASDATGLDDFGATDYHEPMRLLLADIDEHTVLSEAGIELMRQNLVVLLAGRLMTQHGLKSTPESARVAVEQPLVITGFPRTGTTVLQRLLDADPQFQSLPFWLAKMPMPRPPREAWEDHPVYQEVRQGLADLFSLVPDFRTLHPMRPQTGDECRWSIDQSFWTTTLAGTLVIPNYTRWLISSSPARAYDYHRRVLQLVAHGDQRPWLLKDPSHLFALDTVVDLFPGTRFVYTHRDPTECISSVSNLVWAFRPLAEPTLTREQVGTQMLEFWSAAVGKAEAARARLGEQHFCDIHVDETRTNPVATAERIYDYFDIPVPDTTRQAWEAAVTSPTTLAHKSRAQKPQEFGLTRKRVEAAMPEYVRRYAQLKR